MKLIFWQPINSIHQAAMLRSLAADHGHEVHLVARRDLGERHANGWSVPDIAPALFHDLATIDPAAFLAQQHAAGDALSIFSNPFGDPLFRSLWRTCQAQGFAFGFHQARPGTYSGALSRFARHLLYRLVFRRQARDATLILCNGTLCSDWLARAGFPRAALLDWGYFPAVPRVAEPAAASTAGLRCLFVGRLVPYKRPELVLRAVAALRQRHPGISLSILGDGPLAVQLDALGAQLLGPAYQRHPFVPHAEVQGFIGAADCLVLPSSQEEWGAVVNEAILTGTPVVCSERCGSRDLLHRGGGTVFTPDTQAGLATALAAYSEQPAALAAARAQCRAIAPLITPQAAAAHLSTAIHERLAGRAAPRAPWLADGGTHAG